LRQAPAFTSLKRIKIVDVLAQGERNVEILAAEINPSVANTSRQLYVQTTNLVATLRSFQQPLTFK
jgi:hypothetical protein